MHTQIGQKEVLLVSWKKQRGHVEIFDTLEVFILSYPRYGTVELNQALAYGNAFFEDDDVHIERKAVIVRQKPDFPRAFFWDFNYDKINWNANADTVIQRVLERGNVTHRQELERFYGRPSIVQALKDKITYLPDEVIDEASSFFNLKKEEMLCYKRKQSQPIHWL